MRLADLFQQEGKALGKRKGEYIFRQGDADRSLYYLESGLLKAYYSTEDGKESIKSFLLPGDVIGSITSALSQGHCTFSLLCLEPACLVQIPFSVLQSHSQRDLEFANSLVDILIRFAMKKEKREYEFLCLSAEARYQQLLRDDSPILERVTQNDLARYLGITPVALSRIKKRLSDKL